MGRPERHSISDHLYRVIRELLPSGGAILELGSGHGTERLARHYAMTSVEHDEAWLGRFASRYIHAPIRPFRKACAVFPDDAGWYDRDVLARELPSVRYDLILVDGPPNHVGRGGFYKWRHFFDLSVPIVIDDVHRDRERKVIGMISKQLGKGYEVFAWERCHFGIIHSASRCDPANPDPSSDRT